MADLRSDGSPGTPGGQAGSKPWERQPSETAAAYRAFATYLDLGSDRTLVKAALDCKRSVSLLKRWSARHHWLARARAYDDAHAREAEDVAREARRAAYLRRTEHAAQLERIAMAGLRTLVVRDPETSEARFDKRLKPGEIASLIRAACQLLPAAEPEWVAAGESDEADTARLRRLSDEELDEVFAVLQQRQQREVEEDDDETIA